MKVRELIEKLEKIEHEYDLDVYIDNTDDYELCDFVELEYRWKNGAYSLIEVHLTSKDSSYTKEEDCEYVSPSGLNKWRRI